MGGGRSVRRDDQHRSRSDLEAEHHTPDRKVEIKHLKLDLRFDHERRYVEGSATFTLSPINDGLTSFELDIAEMEIESATLTSVEERGADGPQKSPDQAAGFLPGDSNLRRAPKNWRSN